MHRYIPIASTIDHKGSINNLHTISLLAALILAISAYGFTGFVVAQDDSDDTDINISIDSQAEVTVEPDWFNFTDVGLETTDFSESNYLNIRNTGSTNISSIYAHLDTLESEATNPLGSGSADAYAAGRFVWIKNATSSFYHAGSLMWNITEQAGGQPSGITNAPENAVSYGYYRNATGNYLWALSANGTTGGHDGTCNTDGETGSWDAPVLTIKNTADDGSNRDLGTGVETHSLGNNNSNWAQAEVTDGPLDGHYVASHSSCEKLYINRFDNDDAFPMTGNTNQYLVNSNTELAPGDEYTAYLGVAIPSGIPAGITNQTTLTISASEPS